MLGDHLHHLADLGAQPAAARELLAELVEPFELFEQRSANPEHWLGDREQNGIIPNEFQCPGLEPRRPAYPIKHQTSTQRMKTPKSVEILIRNGIGAERLAGVHFERPELGVWSVIGAWTL